ncbi:uncharacterized protein DS421_11g340010 [Arachis hypogaea]|nr:uncharacterized protein DS421_11g340010 [Arachis hypogaea]
MASNAREDTQSNSVAPNDDEIEVQSNVNPTSETPQATDNVSTPEGSTPNEGLNLDLQTFNDDKDAESDQE